MSIPDFDMYMSISMLDFGTYMSMLNEHTGFWYMYMSMLMSIPDFRMYMYMPLISLSHAMRPGLVFWW